MYKIADLKTNIIDFMYPNSHPEYKQQNTEMINLMHGAANYSGNKLRKTDHHNSIPKIGPASLPQISIDSLNDKKKVKEEKKHNITISNNASVYDSHPTAAILTHEMGHIEDNPKASFLDYAPIIGDARTLWKERQANKKSWDAINKIYKDDPELIKMMGEQRSRLLAKAYGTYALANGLPIATTALGCYLGYRRYKDKQKQYQQSVNNINKWLNIAGGAGLGYLGGKAIGMVGTTIPALTMMNQVAKERDATDAIHQRMIQHAKDRGYYNNVDLNQTIGID